MVKSLLKYVVLYLEAKHVRKYNLIKSEVLQNQTKLGCSYVK